VDLLEAKTTRKSRKRSSKPAEDGPLVKLQKLMTLQVQRLSKKQAQVAIMNMVQDWTIRVIHEELVLKYVSIMENGSWDVETTNFVVMVDPEARTTYKVLDGNHRLEAMRRVNNVTASPKFILIQCFIYEPMVFSQQLAILNDHGEKLNSTSGSFTLVEQVSFDS